MPPKRFEDHLTQFAGHGVILGDLQVVLRPGRLVPGGDAAVHPFRAVE